MENSCKVKGHKEKYCERATQYRNRSKSKTRAKTHKKRCGRVVLAGSAEANVNAVRHYVTAEVNGHQMEFQLDTGSDITLLNVDEWKRMGSPKLKDTSLVVKDASGNRMKQYWRIWEFSTQVDLLGVLNAEEIQIQINDQAA
ncbi:hypothetical protein ANCCEY_11680 [Ancylostoma ceylanicum]|uniref:Peptidase A2 domain-containing protein n=1 Tax=Ancylostoma ceylanicum TaxID=53326 RepID=A0A0D6LD90_9BILA|nr:hypothetical protein ANCCEY_11680 [Ancylostoma ceylanicum]